ncbi:MAG: HEPN domain-containing protein [bacterium]
MTPIQRRDLCLYRMKRAHKSLKEARNLLADNLLEGAANRLYYSVFYAVGALALAHDFVTTQHTAFRAWYNKNIAKAGLMDDPIRILYNKAFDQRTEGDYLDMVELDAEVIGTMLLQAEPFITRIEELLMEKLKEEN